MIKLNLFHDLGIKNSDALSVSRTDLNDLIL